MSVGVPIQILQEAEGHTVTVETKSGEIFKGKLVEAEDNMNVQLEACIATFNNGKISNMENIFVRGSKFMYENICISLYFVAEEEGEEDIALIMVVVDQEENDPS
ncbi:Small nuclear ribonucleoprotein Sm D3 [Armadillidium nasatum]|uniref:Small nuclear ribonucleoprotein Sm D3 n=1 Tax=Armadillidium nasatum TaxID=96803 RepID=A0A5N5T4E6_9CRUS|nr:Small nuclear ribonucleoprotein Sm D3 [Armadillidium nasatum]